MDNEEEIRDIIYHVALKHSDSGESSFNRLSRLILKELNSTGYEIVKFSLCDTPASFYCHDESVLLVGNNKELAKEKKCESQCGFCRLSGPVT